MKKTFKIKHILLPQMEKKRKKKEDRLLQGQFWNLVNRQCA